MSATGSRKKADRTRAYIRKVLQVVHPSHVVMEDGTLSPNTAPELTEEEKESRKDEVLKEFNDEELLDIDFSDLNSFMSDVAFLFCEKHREWLSTAEGKEKYNYYSCVMWVG